MCRAEIPPNYLDNPILLEMLTAQEVTTTDTQDGYQWFYEGRNGNQLFLSFLFINKLKNC